jgi:hypothetical protein
MTTVENVETPRNTKQAKHPQDRGGHRYQKGHPHYPRWRTGSRSHAAVFTRRSRKILAAIIAERGGLLTYTQSIHAKNAADLGASIMAMEDGWKNGEPVDRIAHAKLVKAQHHALNAVDADAG